MQPGYIAILQMLAMLGTVTTVLVAVVATVVLLLVDRTRQARVAASFGAGAFGLYAALMATMSLTSHTTTLPPGQLKFFCEIDCHVAFDLVSDPERTGDTVRLMIRERFRRNTISPTRGDGPLFPGSRVIALVDESGKRYRPIEMRQLDSAPLFSPMRPGEVHRAALSFAVPAGVSLTGLLVETDDPIARMLIGHERSPLHGKILLHLSAATDVATGQAR